MQVEGILPMRARPSAGRYLVNIHLITRPHDQDDNSREHHHQDDDRGEDATVLVTGRNKRGPGAA
jgi:hypothetical protein